MDQPSPHLEHDSHEAIAKWERRWLSISGLLSLTFVIFIAYSLATEGAHIAQRNSRTTPDQLANNAVFSNPGVTLLAPGKFQVAAVAQAFAFTPSEIRLPVGAEVDFFLTSRDVIHGFQIQRTNVNVEVLPGEISYLHYKFDEAGEYRLFCNEYCGISHQNMLGKIVVVPASQYARPDETLAAAGIGERIFTANCAACHQASGEGVAGAFPPLKDNLVGLYEAGGRDYLKEVLLNGLQGNITIDGTNYNGIMPAWKQLSDEEIASVLNHTLTAWGTPADFQPYEAAEIAASRAQPIDVNEVLNLRPQR